MSRTTGCTCPPTRRRWQADGTCARCRNRVLETQIMDVVRAVLVADPMCLLWRNEIGSNTHFPDGTPRKHPIKYGVCNPGGADLIGCYGPRMLAVECKTVRGAQSSEQIDFERWITARGNVYAICRSAADAHALLVRLRGETSQRIAPVRAELKGASHCAPRGAR